MEGREALARMEEANPGSLNGWMGWETCRAQRLVRERIRGCSYKEQVRRHGSPGTQPTRPPGNEARAVEMQKQVTEHS